MAYPPSPSRSHRSHPDRAFPSRRGSPADPRSGAAARGTARPHVARRARRRRGRAAELAPTFPWTCRPRGASSPGSPPRSFRSCSAAVPAAAGRRRRACARAGGLRRVPTCSGAVAPGADLAAARAARRGSARPREARRRRGPGTARRGRHRGPRERLRARAARPDPRGTGVRSGAPNSTPSGSSATSSGTRRSHDPLTGLPNRAAAFDRLSAALETGSSGRIGLCYLDLDGFKGVNDRYGHEAGDELLVNVADRIGDRGARRRRARRADRR